MKLKGLALSDFPDLKTALQTADDLIAANKHEYQHPGTVKHHASGNEVLHEFFFTINEGKTKTWQQTQSKTLTAETAPKGRAQLQALGTFVEGLGLPGSVGSKSAGDAPRIECVALKDMREKAERLRSLFCKII